LQTRIPVERRRDPAIVDERDHEFARGKFHHAASGRRLQDPKCSCPVTYLFRSSTSRALSITRTKFSNRRRILLSFKSATSSRLFRNIRHDPWRWRLRRRRLVSAIS
jgi:hypothetical protein